MKKVLTARGVLMLLALIAVSIIGCGGDEVAEEVPESSAMGMMGMMKVPDAAPTAPSAPAVGTPTVTEVAYFHDWKLTKEVQEAVSIGDTIFVKIAFSEPMQHVAADDETARPILYYRRAEEGAQRIRFNMAAHGAGGEDFVSGDAKPLQSGTDDYICKYTVAPEDAGKQVAFMVGKLSVDLENNPLAQFYTHAKRLRVESIAPTQPETPEAAPEPTTTDPLTITAMTHYHDRSDELLPEGASVEEGTTVRTEITFAEPIQAEGLVITYPHASGRKQLTQSTGVHWRGTYQLSRDGVIVRTKLNASGEVFSLTVEAAIGRDGSTLREPVSTSELSVVPEGSSIVSKPQEPGDPEPQVPVRRRVAPQYSFADGVYTVGEETYSGYNPSPGLQHILNTHPAAKLPHFLEAVKMAEVIDWAYRKSGELYSYLGSQPDPDNLAVVRREILKQFGLSPDISIVMSAMVFRTDQIPPPHSRYWFSVEYLRLKLENPDADMRRLLFLFGESDEQGRVVGITNPNI